MTQASSENISELDDETEAASRHLQPREATNANPTEEFARGSSSGSTTRAAASARSDHPEGLKDSLPSRGAQHRAVSRPTYKDQVRSESEFLVSDDHQSTNEYQMVDLDASVLTVGEEEKVSDDGLPAYKDQVRSDAVGSSRQSSSQKEQERVGDEPFVDAEVVTEEDNNQEQQQYTVYEAKAYSLPGGIFISRQRLIVIVMLVVIASVVAGVCSGGLCGGSSIAPEVSSPNGSPTTALPSDVPSSPPTLSPDSRELVEFINRISYSSPITYPTLLSDASPEQLAIQWLLEDDPVNISANVDNERLTQRYALLTFWYSTGGPSWERNDNWLIDEEECSWYGVTCIGGAVSKLGGRNTLTSNNLSGSFPPDIALLQSLTTLDFRNNAKLSGSIPPSLGNLVRMELFVAPSCGLTGHLPDSLGSWTELETFDASSNTLTSTLPSSFSSWSDIIIFHVAENALTGQLPELGEWDPLCKLLDPCCILLVIAPHLTNTIVVRSF